MKKVWGLYFLPRRLHKIQIFANNNVPFKIENFKTGSLGFLKLKSLRNGNLKKKIINEIQEIMYMINKEDRFKKEIDFDRISYKMLQSFSVFMENWKEMGIFLSAAQFLSYTEILRKIKIWEKKGHKMDDFFDFFLKSFAFYLENDLLTSSEFFQFLDCLTTFSQNHAKKRTNEFNDLFFKINLFLKKNSQKKLTLSQFKIMVNFLKEAKLIKDSENLDFFKEIFQDNNLDLQNDKKSEYFIVKLEFLSFSNKNFNENTEINEILNLLKSEDLAFGCNFIRKTSLINSQNSSFNDFLSNLVFQILLMLELKDPSFFETFTILESFKILQKLKPSLVIDPMKTKTFLKIILSLNKSDEATPYPKEIDEIGSKWLYLTNFDERIDENISKIAILAIPTMSLKLLMLIGFLQYMQIVKLIKYESYLFCCIKSELAKEKQESITQEFMEVFQLLTENVADKKIVVFLETFKKVINDILDDINEKKNLKKMSLFLNHLIPKNGMAFSDDYGLLSKIDSCLMNLMDAIDLNENKDIFDIVARIKSFKIPNFYREFIFLVKSKFNTLDFTIKLHYLFIFSKIYSYENYADFMDVFIKEMVPEDLNKIQNVNDLQKLLNILIYGAKIEKIDSYCLKQIFYYLDEFSSKSFNKPSSNYTKSVYNNLDNLLKVGKILYPKILGNLFSEHLKNNLKKILGDKKIIEKTSNKGRFQTEFTLILKQAFSELEIKENFYLFEEEFECDIWIKKWETLVELCGPTHFLPTDNFELSPVFNQILRVKKEILKPKRIVIVPYFEWNELAAGVSNQRINYIKKHIFEIK